MGWARFAHCPRFTGQAKPTWRACERASANPPAGVVACGKLIDSRRLSQADLALVGQLMDASHASLRDDYAVSSPALDAMVEAMRSAPGCYGARLTGAGFGGCAVALVEPGAEQGMADAIFEHYPKATNIWPEVYTTRASDGARVVPIP